MSLIHSWSMSSSMSSCGYHCGLVTLGCDENHNVIIWDESDYLKGV